MSMFARMVELEIQAARRKHQPIHSLHEGYAVVKGELEKFWAVVKVQPEYQIKEALLQELVQVAVMAQRTAEDLGLDKEGDNETPA